MNQLNDKKETALHWALRPARPAFEIIKELVEYGADPLLASGSGATPMGLALKHKEITNIMNCRYRCFMFHGEN